MRANGFMGLLFLVALSACATKGGRAVLFADDFSSGTYPAPNWVGEGMISTSAGAPAPCLFLAATPPVVTGTVQMANPVDLSGGAIITFQAANAAAGAFSDLTLLDVNANSVAASIAFRPSQVRLDISGSGGSVVSITPDTAFHSYELRFSSSGAATWSRDDVVQLQGQLAILPSLGRLLVRADENGLYFDNIEIR